MSITTASRFSARTLPLTEALSLNCTRSAEARCTPPNSAAQAIMRTNIDLTLLLAPAPDKPHCQAGSHYLTSPAPAPTLRPPFYERADLRPDLPQGNRVLSPATAAQGHGAREAPVRSRVDSGGGRRRGNRRPL